MPFFISAHQRGSNGKNSDVSFAAFGIAHKKAGKYRLNNKEYGRFD
jgi:hypothetical protein